MKQTLGVQTEAIRFNVTQIQGHAFLQLCLTVGEEEVTKSMISMRWASKSLLVAEGGVLDVVGNGPKCTTKAGEVEGEWADGPSVQPWIWKAVPGQQ